MSSHLDPSMGNGELSLLELASRKFLLFYKFFLFHHHVANLHDMKYFAYTNMPIQGKRPRQIKNILISLDLKRLSFSRLLVRFVENFSTNFKISDCINIANPLL